MPSFFYIVKSNNKLSIPWVETNSRFMLISAMSFASLVNNSVPMPLIMNPVPWVGGLCQMLQFMFLWFNHFFLLTCCLMPIQIVSVCCFKIAFITAENLLFFGFAFMFFFVISRPQSEHVLLLCVCKWLWSLFWPTNVALHSGQLKFRSSWALLWCSFKSNLVIFATPHRSQRKSISLLVGCCCS